MAKSKVNQPGTFERKASEKWIAEFRNEWRSMPACENRDLRPWKRLEVQFSSQADLDAFKKLVGDDTITTDTQSMWYPPQDDLRVFGYMRWMSRRPDDGQEWEWSA